MSNASQVSDNSHSVFGGAGLSRLSATCKQILNNLVAMANRPAERSRLAALTPRLLEDIGMTVAERDALLR